MGDGLLGALGLEKDMSPPPVDGAGHAGGAVLSPDGKYTPVATTRPAYLDPSSPEMRAILM